MEAFFSGVDWIPAARAMAVVGLFEGFANACTSAALLGISLSKAFSVIFCVALLIFTVIFGFLAWKSTDDKFMRISSIIGAVIMPIAGLCCIFVNENFTHFNNPASKTPLYMIVAVAIMINFAINAIQFINSLSCWNIQDRLLTNNNQVLFLMLMNIVLGVVIGLIFGLMEPEVDDKADRMTTVAVVMLFIGLLGGAGFGFYNEVATQKMEGIGLDPSAPQGSYNKM